MADRYLSTESLTIGYVAPRRPARVVASDLRLSLYSGELVCLIGPNGAGKSTLLRTLAGMQLPLTGRVMLRGAGPQYLDLHDLPTSELARLLAVVLTDRVQVQGMTGYALVALGRHPHTDWSGRLNEHDEAVIRRVVAAVGAEALATRPLDELSDGERQRLLIARALAQEPRLLILDEPTAYLDLPRRVEALRLLRDLARQTGCAVLLSTHDLDLALRAADRLWVIAGGQFAEGAPEDLVLNGTLALAFDAEGVTFDVRTGSFHMAAGHRQFIALESGKLAHDDLRRIWTMRALERLGYTLVPDAPVQVTITAESWRVGDTEADSLTALSALLRL